ncbi:MAG: hypothetical protein RR945_10190 [Erysipelotrichaceae bacterium]|uniref:hypothetical protein n=1 Tax=Anaerorhabdus sp. TaxID=1872524 RepID=UPI002FCC6AA4
MTGLKKYLTKFIKIFISFSIIILSIVYVPPLEKEVVKDVYATVCDLSKPETCQKEIVKYLLALLGIRILTDDGVLEYVEDVIEYKNQNGSDLFSSWDIQAAANNQIRMSSQGLLTFFQDIFNFNKSKNIPWESGDLKYVNGNTIEFYNNSLKLSNKGSIQVQIAEGNVTNTLKFYEILDHDFNTTYNVQGLGVIGNVSGKYTGGYSSFVTIRYPRVSHGLYGFETQELSPNKNYYKLLDINYYLEWAPVGKNDFSLTEDTIVLWQKSAFIKGTNNLGTNGNIPISFWSKTKNKMMLYTKEYADSLPLQSNIGMEDLPKSQQEFLDRFNIPSGIFDLQGIDLMQRDYHDFLEKIPLIYDQTFTETIPLPTAVPTVPPFPTTAPYPTSIPFPTSIPNDWAESIPLPPLDLPALGGDEPLSNAGAGALTGASFGWLGNALNSLMGNIGNMIKALLDAIVKIPAQIVNGIGDLIKWLGNILSQILNAVLSIPDVIAKAVATVIEFVTSLFFPASFDFAAIFFPLQELVKSKFPFINDLSSIFKSLFNTFINFNCTNACIVVSEVSLLGQPLIPRLEFDLSVFKSHFSILFNAYYIFMGFVLSLNTFNFIYDRFKRLLEKGWH